MKRKGRRSPGRAAPIDPELERRWDEALRERPAHPREVAAWDAKHRGLLASYQLAVAEAEERERELKSGRARLRRKVVAVAICIALAITGIVYWTNRPSADDLRSQAIQREDAACGTHYSQTHHLKLVGKQIDLLADGEGGWVDFTVYPNEAPTVGGVDLTPAELQAGKAGTAQVNRENYVYDSTLGIGSWGLLERRDGKLVLTLFAYPSGYGELPHAPLTVATSLIATATLRGEQISSVCWQ